MKHIGIFAVNSAGRSIETSLGLSLRILPPARRQLILDEIRRIMKISTIMVDTSFFQGFHQRIRKDSVMKQLFELLDGLSGIEIKAELDDDDRFQDNMEAEWKNNQQKEEMRKLEAKEL